MFDGPEGEGDGLAERLWKLVGEQADPEITLGEPPADVSAEIVERLRAHGLKETRYQVQGEVARGGMGAILEVWDEDLRRRLAMKVALAQGADGVARSDASTHELDPKALGRFLEEAQVTGQLDHPGIVPVHELGVDAQGQVYFTMRLVKGRDLKEVFADVHSGDEQWTRTRALGVLLKVCEAMAFAHAKGVIHRDLKPANVMVGRFGEVYVMDWGVARVLGADDLHDLRLRTDAEQMTLVRSERRDPDSADVEKAILTMDGDVVGTPCFMSPEQARGELGTLDARTDVYAMGSMLYNLLSGEMPFVPKDSNAHPYAVLMRLLEGPPRPLYELAPDAPAELIAITEKAMERDPGDRYPDMQALGEDLRAYLEHRVVGAYETGAVAEFRKWVERNRALASTVLAATLLVVGGTTVWSLVLSSKNEDLRVARGAAEESADIARTERANVLRLSAFKKLDDLRSEADELWPAAPEEAARMEDWLVRARRLVDGLHASPGSEEPGFYELLDTLRERALPYTDAERRADVAAHPRALEHEALRTRVESYRRAQAVREGREEPPKVEVDLSRFPSDPTELNEHAWTRVHPRRTDFGHEAEGLALAREAYARAAPEQRTTVGDTLAWALFAVGLDEEALATSDAALAGAAPHERSPMTTALGELEARIFEASTRLAEAEEALAAFESDVLTRATWTFANDDDAWWHARLTELVHELETFADEDVGLFTGVSPRHGWGVERRLEYARSVRERTVAGPEAAALWEEAIRSIADEAECPAYGGLRLDPQLGLLPLGQDRDSGLWEFAHVMSGDVPGRDPRGELIFREGTCMVLVLVPGGTGWIGAQSEDRRRPNFDPLARDEENPVQIVELSAFFLAKHELTQGQWLGLMGENPAFYDVTRRFGDKQHDLTHPVERVSWLDARVVLHRAGLELPTEAQWEYAARAGTAAPRWTGNDPRDLGYAANLADDFARRNGGPITWDFAPWSDGYTVHAPVDGLRANGFGLHHVLGNVWEMCLDGFLNPPSAAGPDPLVPYEGRPHRVIRGSSFSNSADDTRSAVRSVCRPDAEDLPNVGVRAARAISGR